MHHGITIQQSDMLKMYTLEHLLAWAIRGILIRYHYICDKFGSSVDGMRKFFEYEKLSGGTSTNDIVDHLKNKLPVKKTN